MSLSRFYKDNDAFHAKAILDSISDVPSTPIWKSIVQTEDSSPQQEDEPELDMSPPLPDELLTDDRSDEHTDSVTEVMEPPEPAAKPTIDLEAIYEAAYSEGVTEGRQQAEEDFANSAQTLLNICHELDNLRETILKNSSNEMKELVLKISEKIIRHSVTVQSETILATIKDAIHLAVQSDAFQIQLNPEDLKAVESHKKEVIDSISGLDHIVLKPDATIERGGCKLESTYCTVDASLTSQIEVIHEAVMTADTLINPLKSE